MSEFDTLRWGDTQQLLFKTAGGGFVGGNVQRSNQLLQARWPRPLEWRIMASVLPLIDPGVGEVATFTATLTLNIGCGGGMMTVPFPIALATPYPQQTIFLDIPAQDIQGQFSVDLTGADDHTTTHGFLLGVFAAPHTEPAGYTDTRALLRALAENYQAASRLSPDSADLPRWMPPGFEDGELRYRR